MKTFVVVGMAIVLSGPHIHAQSTSGMVVGDQSPLARLESYRLCDLQKAERPLLNSLNHDVEGVVVSTLREIAKLKLAQPVCTSDPIAEKVDDLVRNGSTPAVRYKAYLTSIVLSMPRFFASEGLVQFQSDEQFFTALARRLEGLALRNEG